MKERWAIYTNSTQTNAEDAPRSNLLSLQLQVSSPTLVDTLRQRALLQPTQLAYKFLKYTNTACIERDWTYQELDQQARLIATALTNLEMFQETVLLLFPSGLEYIAALYGCFYAGAIAVPAYPPRHARSSTDRISSILESARPSVILTTSSLLATVREWLHFTSTAADSTVIAVDMLDATLDQAWQKPPISRDSLAFLQYTSGSTAAPKGVMISHGNLLHNSTLIHHYSQTDENDACVSWLPIYHDMGLIAGVIQPAYVGYPLVFMDPVQFLQFPMRWLYAIAQHKGTITYAPNFAFEQCIRRAKPQDIASLDLTHWRRAVNGAEPIRAETLERFLEIFSPCGLRRETLKFCYGLAEATLVVTSDIVDSLPVAQKFDKEALARNKVVAVAEHNAHGQKLAGCGFPALGQKVVIVHPESRTRCLPDEVGEIWIQGESVAQGYWENKEATEEIFHASLSDSDEKPFMRTGDLGFFYANNLYIAGRIKDVIILNGCNHYPQDIELTIEKSHPSLIAGGCVAFSIEQAGKEQLVVMAEVNPRYRWPQDQVETPNHRPGLDLQRIIRRSIVDAHDIEVHEVVILKMGEVLKTSSGKLQRRACRVKYLAGNLNRWDA